MIVFIAMFFLLVLSILQLCIVIRSDSDKRWNSDHTEKVVAILKEKSIKGTFLRIIIILQILVMLFLLLYSSNILLST